MAKSDITKLQENIWEECKRIIRARYAIKTPNSAPETWECYTCGKVISAKSDAQTGHFIPRSTCGAFLKYDLRNLRIQCMACNVWKGGNGAIFYRNMVEREGQEYVDKIFADKQKTIKESDHFRMILEQYKNIHE